MRFPAQSTTLPSSLGDNLAMAMRVPRAAGCGLPCPGENQWLIWGMNRVAMGGYSVMSCVMLWPGSTTTTTLLVSSPAEQTISYTPTAS